MALRVLTDRTQRAATPSAVSRYLNPHHTVALAAELYANQVNRLASRPILLRIATLADLLQRLALGDQLHHLQLEKVDLALALVGAGRPA